MLVEITVLALRDRSTPNDTISTSALRCSYRSLSVDRKSGSNGSSPRLIGVSA